MNKVFAAKESMCEMTRQELTLAFYENLPKLRVKPYEMDRLSGNHCECYGDGEFVLLPANDLSVIEGRKRYMICRKCGGPSHL